MNDPYRRLKLLVVDDTQLMREVLCEQLRLLGHEPIEAEDGESAIAQFIAAVPDVVLMDLMMPGLDGIETTRAIRQLPNARWVPIIMLSAESAESEFINALSSGCDDYLVKPIKLPILEAKINALQRIADMHYEIENSERELQLFYTRAEEELRLTQHIMARLVQRDGDGPAMATWSEAASGASGDIILTSRAENGVRYIMLADATGHGLAAAVTLIPVANVFYAMTAKGFNVATVIEEMNRQVRSYCPIERFVALALVAVNPKDGMIEVWNGGIPPLLLFDELGEEQRRFASRHLPLGIVGGAAFRNDTEFCHYDRPLQLALFSDGLIEAGDREQFGLGRIAAVLAETPPQQRLPALQNALAGFLGSERPHDDISCALFDCPLPSAPLLHAENNAERSGPRAAQDDWRLQTVLSAAQLKRIDVVPMIVNWAQAMGLSKANGGTFFLVITELFLNALEHGLLELSSAQKQQPDGFERYLEARMARLQALQEGFIDITLSYMGAEDHGTIAIHIRDSGKGFDVDRLDVRKLGDNQTFSGRGIALVRRFCRRVEYRGAGNEVYAELDC